MTNQFDTKRISLEKAAKIGGALGICVVAAPFVLLAIKGLLGLIVVGLIGTGTFQLMPLIATKFANWRLKQFKAEAAKNPIEYLQNDYNERAKACEAFRKQVAGTKTAISNVADTLAEYKQKNPAIAAKYEVELVKMQQVYALRSAKYLRSKAALAQYWTDICMKSDEWNVAQTIAAANKTIGTADGEEFLQKVLQDVAFDSVKNAVNESLSELDMVVTDEGAQKQIAAQATITDVTPKALSAHPVGDDPLDEPIQTFEAVPVKAGGR